jgi:hypothetical protein
MDKNQPLLVPCPLETICQAYHELGGKLMLPFTLK